MSRPFFGAVICKSHGGLLANGEIKDHISYGQSCLQYMYMLLVKRDHSFHSSVDTYDT